jgi:tetratricopeptide (TPR) repeat protein
LRHLKANQYDEAVTALQQATAVYRKLGDRRGEARSLLNLGLTYLGLSNGAKAIHVGQQALAIAQALSDPELEKLAQEILAAGQKQVATNAANTTQNLAKCSINWGL